MKKVVSIVLNNFKNDSRVLKENLSLQKAGYDVKVVALHEEPLKEFEIVENIPVHRIKLRSRGWSKQKLIQLLKYIEFVFKAVNRYGDSDIVHCNDLNALPIGVIIKKLFNKKIKIVYDAHEYEINDVPNQSSRSIKMKYFLEKFLIRYADAVMTVSNGIADEYVKMYKIPKPALVLNTPSFQNVEKKNIFREAFGIKDEQTIFLYQGGLSRGRGIEILLEAFKSLHSSTSALQPCIVFMGYGSLESLIQKSAEEYSNIHFHRAVSPDVLLDYTSSADFGILFYENNCLNHEYCSPNKMFEYLMAGIPVIVSNLYEMKRLVEINCAGIVAKENTPEGLKEAIKKAAILDRKKLESSIGKLKAVYNWGQQEKVLLNLYRDLESCAE